MKQRIDEELELDQEERSFSIITNKFLGTTVHPHPLIEEDIAEVGL